MARSARCSTSSPSPSCCGSSTAHATEFRSGWFVESLATQTLVIFAIRTKRVAFFRSHPSLPLTLAALGVGLIGALLPAIPIAHTLGFSPLPGAFFAALAGMVVTYLLLIEFGKGYFYRASRVTISTERRPYNRTRHLLRRAARFTPHNNPRELRRPADRAAQRIA